MYIEWNPSPLGAHVGDCSVRAISKVLDIDWATAYTMLCVRGFDLYDMPSSNAVVNSLLTMRGFERGTVPNTCPDCYTIEDFAADHPHGTFVVGTGNHLVAICDGDVYDNWDSTGEIPIFFWEKKK